MAPNALLDSHEDRLQRMDVIVGETRSEVAGLVAEVAHLGVAVEKQGQDLAEQLREGFSSLQSSVHDLEKGQQRARLEFERAQARIKRLEEEEKARVRKQGRINKVVFGLFLAGVTTLVTKAAAWLWTFLGHKP